MESYLENKDDDMKEYSEESEGSAQEPNDGEESPEESSHEGEVGDSSEYDFEEALKQQFSENEKGMQLERYVNILVHYFTLNICVTFRKYVLQLLIFDINSGFTMGSHIVVNLGNNQYPVEVCTRY